MNKSVPCGIKVNERTYNPFAIRIASLVSHTASALITLITFICQRRVYSSTPVRQLLFFTTPIHIPQCTIFEWMIVCAWSHDHWLCVLSSIWILGDDMKFNKLVLSQYGWDFDLSDQDIMVRRLMPNKKMCLGYEIVLTKNQIASIKKDMQEKYLKEDYQTIINTRTALHKQLDESVSTIDYQNKEITMLAEQRDPIGTLAKGFRQLGALYDEDKAQALAAAGDVMQADLDADKEVRRQAKAMAVEDVVGEEPSNTSLDVPFWIGTEGGTVNNNGIKTVFNGRFSDVLLASFSGAGSLNFEGDGLTITQKNGKVYVSLEEKLLFSSGSWQIDERGQDALSKLSQALENQSGIDIMIEGHTDSIPFNGGGHIKDNWDLSVVRATSIVKILVESSNISENRLTAAGRGEFHPIESNLMESGRQANRRIEIILSPKLDELYNLIN